jgi:hypothetical protein
MGMQEELRQQLVARVKNAYIRLPRDVSFDKKGNVHTVHFSEQAVVANMQANQAAFEGWVLAIKALLGEGGCQSVQISWESPGNVNDRHYQRFLYRLIRFRQTVDWFLIAPECESLLMASRVLNPDGNPRQDRTLFINSASCSRNSCKGASEESTSRRREHDLELHFCDNSNELLDAISWRGKMQRQLPVGIFEGTVSKSSYVFTGGKSAIDLWASDPNNGVAIFELKTPDNRQIGAISELFFYTSLIKDVAEGVFRYKRDGELEKSIREAKKVSGFIVSGQIHPLLDNEKLFELLNNAFDSREMQFGYIEYDDNLHVRRTIPRH